MNFEKCANLWLGRLDRQLKYLDPYALISFAGTNKSISSYVKIYFSTLIKKSQQKDLISLDKDKKWSISKESPYDYLLFMIVLDGIKIIIHPKIIYRDKDYIKIYAWVVWDSERKHECYGKWANWFLLSDDDRNPINHITKIIPWREKNELAQENETH